MARVVFHAEILEKGEDKLVSASELKKVIRQLRRNPDKGKPLRGELKGLRTIRMTDSRLVHRSSVDSKNPGETVVEIVVIQRRRDDEVYDEAKKRLDL